MPEPVFPDGATRFLEQLAAHNDRAWFTAHRAEYDELVAEPLRALLDQATGRYGPGRVMRQHRDVRFSKDKSPYKTTASLWAGELGGVYLQLDATGIVAGGGLYEPSRDQLERAREAIDGEPEAARRLGTVVRRLERGGFALAGPSLTTAPRGYPKDHPAIDLLRLRHYAATRRLPADADVDAVETAWAATQPLIAWVADWVGPAAHRPG